MAGTQTGAATVLKSMEIDDILRPPEACTLVGQGDNKKEVNKNIQYNLKWIYVL